MQVGAGFDREQVACYHDVRLAGRFEGSEE
jgi:hypothetical protein